MKRILLIVFFYFLMNSAWSASYNNTPPKSKNTHPSHNTPTKSKNTHATHSTLAKSKVTRTSFNAPSKSRITRTPYIGGGIGGFIPQINTYHYIPTGAGWPADQYTSDYISSKPYIYLNTGYVWNRKAMWLPYYSLGLRYTYVSHKI